MDKEKREEQQQDVIQNERKEYREKLRKHRLKSRMIEIGVTVGLAVCIVGLYAYQQFRSFDSYRIMWESDMEQAQKERCVSWGKYILQYSENGASCMDGDGTIIWSTSYEMLDPKVVIQDEYALIMDCNGTQFFICHNRRGVTGKGNTPYVIQQGQVATQGTAAIICEKDSVSYIYYYKMTGEKLDVEVKAPMERVGYPLAMDISPDGKSLMVSYLYVESGAMLDKIIFYDFSDANSDVTTSTFSHYADTDTIIPALLYVDDKHAIAIGDNRLTFYEIAFKDGGRIPTIKKELVMENQIISMFAENGCVGFVWEEEVKKEEDSSATMVGEKVKKLTLYDSVGKVVFEKKIDFNYDNIIYNGTYVVLYNETECIMYNNNGNVKYENTFLNGISQILQGASSKEFYLIIGDSIQKIRLV